MLIKAYCINVVVDIKPIYLNKRYLFQNNIYCLDKIYICFTKNKAGYEIGVKLQTLCKRT